MTKTTKSAHTGLTNLRALSPQTLFHFTKSKNQLFGILESNFKPSFSLERIYQGAGDTHISFGAPMVSFCDLRLSELHQHIGKYGCYGIGMSKEWANQNKLNTVYYINKHSNLASEFDLALRHLFSIQQENDISGLDGTYMRLLNLNRFMKNYEAPLYRNNTLLDPNYRFADEREWRYVPDVTDIKSLLTSFAPIDIMTDQEKKKSYNLALQDRPLVFAPKDIRYIIVAKESERDEAIAHISAVKGKNFPAAEIVRLQSRVLSAAQIFQDV